MKTIITCSLLIISALAANAQAISLNQDFNSSCASATGFPIDWGQYNPVITSGSNGYWQCAPTDGRGGTPGLSCSGVWSTTYHLDTCYLISPPLNLSSYSEINILFDTKTTNINFAARLDLLTSTDSTFHAPGDTIYSLTGALSPLFTNADSSDWVTHEADLTPFKSSIPLYVAFRYSSTSTTGSIWYLDNIHTSTFPAKVATLTGNTLPVTVIGNSTSSQISLSCNIELPGIYHLAVYDMIGHIVHEEDRNVTSGNEAFNITGLQLHSGMYLIKMGNGLIYGTTKTIVP